MNVPEAVTDEKVTRIPLRKQAELRKKADEFLRDTEVLVHLCVSTRDCGRLDALVEAVAMAESLRLMKVLRERGFASELVQLCRKADEAVYGEQ